MLLANGHLEVLQWARANGCDWDSLTCTYAAANGHLEVLQWARANGCDWNPRACIAEAGRSEHWEIVVWIYHNSEYSIEELEGIIREENGFSLDFDETMALLVGEFGLMR